MGDCPNPAVERPYIGRDRSKPTVDCPYIKRDRPYIEADRPKHAVDRSYIEADRPKFTVDRRYIDRDRPKLTVDHIFRETNQNTPRTAQSPHKIVTLKSDFNPQITPKSQLCRYVAHPKFSYGKNHRNLLNLLVSSRRGDKR